MNDSARCSLENLQGKAKHDDQPEQLVSAEGLLALLWEEKSRPSLRWLREQQARRTIPFIKIGARVWFWPSAVQEHLEEKWGRKRR
jgi:hypothetical protein